MILASMATSNEHWVRVAEIRGQWLTNLTFQDTCPLATDLDAISYDDFMHNDLLSLNMPLSHWRLKTSIGITESEACRCVCFQIMVNCSTPSYMREMSIYPSGACVYFYHYRGQTRAGYFFVLELTAGKGCCHSYLNRSHTEKEIICFGRRAFCFKQKITNYVERSM